MKLPGFDYPVQLPKEWDTEQKRPDVHTEKYEQAGALLNFLSRFSTNRERLQRLLIRTAHQLDNNSAFGYRPHMNRKILVTTASGCRYLVPWSWWVDQRTEDCFDGPYHGEASETAFEGLWESVAENEDDLLCSLIEASFSTVQEMVLQISGPVPEDRIEDWENGDSEATIL